jgi:serine/threonine protein kinase
MKSIETESCDDSKLQQLLVLDENSRELNKVSTHVDDCPRCQNRLVELAASADRWSETCDLLSDVDVSADHVERAASTKLDFLSEPTHPEMLGRMGRYEIEKVVGRGGMGVVLKGHDGELNRPVAIKVLAPHLAHNGLARQRFAREGRAAAAVVHEHVVPIYGVDSDADLPFLVMHYVAGQSLQSRVDHEGQLPVADILRIGIQVAAGLSAAHAQGVIHRDIKPSNILLEQTVDRVLITDFGLARAADDASLTQSGILAGTPHYMSPEQASGDPIDHRSDLFSLGSVLYFMATGRQPFRAERAMAVLNRICNEAHRPVWEINPEIPDELCDIIDQLLEKKPRSRFADAGQVQAALSRVLVTVQQPVQQPGQRRVRSKMRRWVRQRRRAFIGAAVLLVGSLAVSMLLPDSSQNQSGASTATESFGQQTAKQAKREEVNSEDAKSDGVLSAIAGEQKLDRDFADEINAVQITLRDLEAAHTFEGSGFLHGGTTGWGAEIDDLHRRLVAVEESLAIPSSSITSSNGETE